MSKNPTTRNACFTSYKDEFKLQENDAIVYAIWQKEQCPKTGKMHYQGYIELSKSLRYSGIKKILEDEKAHIEGRRGTREEARNYCRKNDTRIEGPWEIGVWRENAQGKRSDLDTTYELISSGASAYDILDKQPSTFIKYHRGITNAMFLHNSLRAKKTIRDIRVELFWGPPGTGKTRSVFADNPELFILTRGSGTNVWWDGYEGETTILIDDFYGWIPFNVLLSLLDRYPFRLEIKGGHTWANWTKVYLTSNKAWHEWYLNTNGDIMALERRLHRIVKYESGGGTTIEKEIKIKTPESSDEEEDEESFYENLKKSTEY
uniref:ATP-dependent helicase Rep n=1 Tax=uncultured virus TaxID=340016 RepID=A0A1D8MK36_9VIRU